MPERRTLLAGLGALAGVAAISGRAGAGPLVPPAGPVASTGKTLTEVEPRIAVSATTTPGDGSAVFVITQPGSYYLTGNIGVPAGKSGVRLNAARITLDLNGFRIDGAGAVGSSGVSDGGFGRADVCVRNGTISGMNGIGINLAASERATIDNVTVRGGANTGVHVGVSAQLRDVIAESNGFVSGAPGIRAGNDSRLWGCIARGNSGDGIEAGDRCVITECLAVANLSDGIDPGLESTIHRCFANDNVMNGIAGGAALSACVVSDNTRSGILTTRASIEGCVARANREANIFMGGGGSAAECVSSSSVNASLFAPGFDVGATGTISACVSFSNQGAGIQASQHVKIERCVCRSDQGDAIITTSGTSFIIDNTCTNWGQFGFNVAGIHAQGNANRIESNLCMSGNSFGIRLTGEGSFVARNMTGLTAVNWSISPNNVYGPVIDRTTATASGMLGNGTVASTLTTADPYANFTI